MQTSLIAPAKDKYKVRNWKAYNGNLCKRGSLTLWIEDSVLRSWRDIDPSKKVVGQQLYPECVILCCLLLKMQYDQPLRQTTGFVGSILNLIGLGHYAIPDYSTLSRRQSDLPVELSKRWQKGDKIEVAIDSTGLKVYGEGEWKVRKHGVSKRRVWRKLHVAIDVNTQEIIDVALTGHEKDDAAVAQEIIEGRIEKIATFRGDGAYDDFGLRKKLGTAIVQIIPPPKDAVVHKATKKKPLKDFLVQRNKAVEAINNQGRQAWKQQVGYHLRSRNEVAMFRYKTIFGGQMKARTFTNQKVEALIKAKILNTYRELGMPVSYHVE